MCIEYFASWAPGFVFDELVGNQGKAGLSMQVTRVVHSGDGMCI